MQPRTMGLFSKANPEKQYIALCEEIFAESKKLVQQEPKLEPYEIYFSVWHQQLKKRGMEHFAGPRHASYYPNRLLLLTGNLPTLSQTTPT